MLEEYTERTFTLHNDTTSDERIVRQFQFTDWPDNGVPQNPSRFLRYVHKVMTSAMENAKPIVVHCSNGCGRTGVFITIYTQIQRIKAESNVDIFWFVKDMRSGRCFMVQEEVSVSGFCSIIVHELIQPTLLHVVQWIAWATCISKVGCTGAPLQTYVYSLNYTCTEDRVGRY